jgi:rubrerythrin
MMVKDDKSRKNRYKSYLNSELEAAALYSALAKVEKDVERREIFLELVRAEMKHAVRWAEKLGMDPSSIKPEFPSAKLKLMKLIASLFGTRKVLPIVLKLEADEVAVYRSDPEALTWWKRR